MARFNKKRIGPTLTLTCAAAVLPLLTEADEPKIDGRMLGATEAIMNYCAKVDPTSGDRYRQQIKLMVQGTSDAALAKVRDSEEYKQGHDSIEDMLSKTDEHHAKQTCSESASPTK